MASAVPVATRIAAGVLLAAAVGGGIVLFTSHTGASPSEQARKEVQSLFVNPATAKQTARVRSCQQIGANVDARIFLCDFAATGCTRIGSFAVYRDSALAATLISPDTYVLRRPCAPAHG
jgi:hypothetical protein